ncbi:FBA_3 domain-containing protein [Psidium guajava]|nr:FBA_3 domain-containing protein [Psidium guajava]
MRGNIKIVSFDLSDEQFRNVSEPECEDFWRSKFDLVELGGCLAAAVLSWSGAFRDLGHERVRHEGVVDQGLRTALDLTRPRGSKNREHGESNDPSCSNSRIVMRKSYRLYVRGPGDVEEWQYLVGIP